MGKIRSEQNVLLQKRTRQTMEKGEWRRANAFLPCLLDGRTSGRNSGNFIDAYRSLEKDLVL